MRVQLLHVSPRVPQAVSRPPIWQTSFSSQQPVHVEEQFADPGPPVHTPPAHVAPIVAPQSAQAMPPVPQARFVVPIWQRLRASQQPGQVTEQVDVHEPFLQIFPELVQLVQICPGFPHAVSIEIMLHRPLAVQQLAHSGAQLASASLEEPLLELVEPLELSDPLDDPPPLLPELPSPPGATTQTSLRHVSPALHVPFS
jgi:hypothetical protein